MANRLGKESVAWVYSDLYPLDNELDAALAASRSDCTNCHNCHCDFGSCFGGANCHMDCNLRADSANCCCNDLDWYLLGTSLGCCHNVANHHSMASNHRIGEAVLTAKGSYAWT